MLLCIPERPSKSLLAYTFHKPIELYRINMRKYHNSLHKCSVQPSLIFFNHIGCKCIDPCKQMRLQKRLRILQRFAAFGIKTVGMGLSRENLAHTDDEYTETIARACDEAGADAITAIDSIGPTYRVDITTGRPLIGGHGYGYMTGAPILPIALRYVHDIAAKTNKDLIGLGGVTNAEAAMEMLMAGATAVGVCTAAIVNGPGVFTQLTENLSKLMDKYGYPDIPSVSGLTLRNGTLEEKSPADFVFEADKCVHCNRCITACAYRARSFDEQGNMHVDANQCRVCGLCFGMCNKKAIYIK